MPPSADDYERLGFGDEALEWVFFANTARLLQPTYGDRRRRGGYSPATLSGTRSRKAAPGASASGSAVSDFKRWSSK